MKRFDNSVEEYLLNHPELHYSRYSDYMLLSSELDNNKSLEALFAFIVDELKKAGYEVGFEDNNQVLVISW